MSREENFDPPKKRHKTRVDTDGGPVHLYLHPNRERIKIFRMPPTVQYLKFSFKDDRIVGSVDILNQLADEGILKKSHSLTNVASIHVMKMGKQNPVVDFNTLALVFSCMINYHEKTMERKKRILKELEMASYEREKIIRSKMNNRGYSHQHQQPVRGPGYHGRGGGGGLDEYYEDERRRNNYGGQRKYYNDNQWVGKKRRR